MPIKVRQLLLDLFPHSYAQRSQEVSGARHETLVTAHPIYGTKD